MSTLPQACLWSLLQASTGRLLREWKNPALDEQGHGSAGDDGDVGRNAVSRIKQASERKSANA